MKKKNIEILVQKIFEKVNKFNVQLLIIDDNSPDDTAKIVKRLIKEQYPNNLHIIERKEKFGLASAYIQGFKWGMSNNFDYFIEMDADLSHNPKYLTKMFEYSLQYDCVIGSRYVKNGGIKGWGYLRKFISKGGSLYARIILGVPIKDLTGGFNLWNRKVLTNINIDSIFSHGYSFQIELKYRAYKHNFKIKEFPIIFEDRRKGKSKLSKKIFIEAIFKVIKFKLAIKQAKND